MKAHLLLLGGKIGKKKAPKLEKKRAVFVGKTGEKGKENSTPEGGRSRETKEVSEEKKKQECHRRREKTPENIELGEKGEKNKLPCIAEVGDHEEKAGKRNRTKTKKKKKKMGGGGIKKGLPWPKDLILLEGDPEREGGQC